MLSLDYISLRIKEAKSYEQFINKFVVVKYNNGKIVLGILKEILPSGKLLISGDKRDATVDPLDQFLFNAKDDERKGDNHE